MDHSHLSVQDRVMAMHLLLSLSAPVGRKVKQAIRTDFVTVRPDTPSDANRKFEKHPLQSFDLDMG